MCGTLGKKRPSCTRLKDLDSAGMEKLTSFCAMSGFPRRQTCKVSGFLQHAGCGVKKQGRKGKGRIKDPQETTRNSKKKPAYRDGRVNSKKGAS